MKTITDSRYLITRFLSEKIKEICKELPSKRILDIGCGKKPYKLFFSKATNYVGIDKRSASADVLGVAECLPFRSKIFDAVLCTQVLEHVEKPRKVLREINRVLTDNGVLVLSTHGFWIEGHEPTDYWRWTFQGLYKIFNESGFNITESYSMEPYPSFFQFISLFIPVSLIGKLLQVFINLSGLILNSLGNRGPRLHVVHVIKAAKKSKQIYEKT